MITYPKYIVVVYIITCMNSPIINIIILAFIYNYYVFDYIPLLQVLVT